MLPLRLGKIPSGWNRRAVCNDHWRRSCSSSRRLVWGLVLWKLHFSRCARLVRTCVCGIRTPGVRHWPHEAIRRRGSSRGGRWSCGYFQQFYAGKDYLLVASGDSLFRFSPDGKVLWSAPNLGLDGVVVRSVQNETFKVTVNGTLKRREVVPGAARLW